MLPNFVNAAVVFEDNFDYQPDWTPNCLVCGISDIGATGGYSGTFLNGWQYFRNDEYWNQYSTVNYGSFGATPNAEPTIQVKGGLPYTTSGKALIVNNESESDSPNGGGTGWSSDGILAYISPSDHPEVYMQFKIKYQANFTRYWAVNNSESIKTARFEHYDRSGSPFYNGAPGNVSPAYILQTGQNAYGEAVVSDSVRCDPQQDVYINYLGNSYRLPFRYAYPVTGVFPTSAPWQQIAYSAAYPEWNDTTTYTASNYWCDQMITLPVTKSYFTTPSPTCSLITGFPSDATATTTQAIGIFDGNWHTITMHAKLNSMIGVNDGIYELIYDGCVLKYLNNMGWIGVNGNIDAGWNAFMLGGNVFNNYLGITNHVYQSGAEQWYAIDDFVVSTSSIPDDYVIGSAVDDLISPSAPSGLSVM